MSTENLEQFMDNVADSEELQAKIGEEIEAKALIALGAECGCEFTAEELLESAERGTDAEFNDMGGAIKAGGRAGMVSWVVSERKSQLSDLATGPRLEPVQHFFRRRGFMINFVYPRFIFYD